MVIEINNQKGEKDGVKGVYVREEFDLSREKE